MVRATASVVARAIAALSYGGMNRSHSLTPFTTRFSDRQAGDSCPGGGFHAHRIMREKVCNEEADPVQS